MTKPPKRLPAKISIPLIPRLKAPPVIIRTADDVERDRRADKLWIESRVLRAEEGRLLRERIRYIAALEAEATTDRVNEILHQHGLDPADPSSLKRLVLILTTKEGGDPRQKWDEITLGRMLVAYGMLIERLPHKRAAHELARPYPRYAERTIQRRLMDAFKTHIEPMEKKLARRVEAHSWRKTRRRREALKVFCAIFPADLKYYGGTEDRCREMYGAAWPKIR